MGWLKEHGWSLFQTVVTVASMTWAIVQWLYNNKVGFYLWWVKHFARWRDTIWDLSATYEVFRDAEDIIVKLEPALKQQFGLEALSRDMNSPTKRIYTVGPYVISAEDNRDTVEDPALTEVFVKVRRVNVTVAMARNRLTELEELFSNFEDAMGPTDVSYNIDVYFPKKNPFYGLMIERIGEERVTDFLCGIDVAALDSGQDAQGKGRKAFVSRDRVSITHRRFSTARQIAETFMLLK